MSRKHHEQKGALSKTPSRKQVIAHRRTFRGRSRRLKTGIKIAFWLGTALILLGAIYVLNAGKGSPTGSPATGRFSFAVGTPGPGELAPPIRLPATDGSTFELASLRGKTVLLFFQEGLSCQPCWDQIKDIESNSSQFRALGVEKIVSITTDSLDALKQKVASEGITTPILSDSTFAVSQTYHANDYGMMKGTSDGHSFLIVGADGRIRWRADYGGPPDYTMYVPITSLLADIKEGLRENA